MTRQHPDKSSSMAPIQGAFDVTPSASDLTYITRAIMVSSDDVQVTGYLEGDKDNIHQTFALKAGLLYPFAFKKITAVSNSGTIKAYY